ADDAVEAAASAAAATAQRAEENGDGDEPDHGPSHTRRGPRMQSGTLEREVHDARLERVAAQRVDLHQARRAGDVHLGELAADDVDARKPEAKIVEGRRQPAADLAIPR